MNSSEPVLSRLRRHPILVLWLGTQLVVLAAYMFWAVPFSAPDTHHSGMLLTIVFGVLLFPGVQLVMGVMALLLPFAEYLGLYPTQIPSWMGAIVLAAGWGLSAYLTQLFWTSILARVRRLSHASASSTSS